MCGGGGGASNEEARQDADERHQENMDLQRESMAEQKRQFEVTRAENRSRYEEQKAIAEAAPPPPPEETAGVATPAIESLRIRGAGRKNYITGPVQATGRSTRNRRASGASLHIS